MADWTARHVPEELLPAAELITNTDGYGGQVTFRQGRGPLCFGNPEVQEGILFSKAEHYRKLADAYESLGFWMADLNTDKEAPND